MRRGYAEVSDGQVHYVEDGAGEPLLLLHRTPRSSRDYWKLMPVLAAHHRVIAMDTLGFGRSDRLPPDATMERLASSAAELLAQLGIARAHVFGLHTGNKIAAALAAEHPERVMRAVLCGQTHSIIDDKAARDAAIYRIVQHYFLDAEPTPDGSHLLRGWAAHYGNVAKFWWNRTILARGTLTEEHLRYMEYELLDYLECLPDIAAIYQVNFQFDFGATLRRIAAPTLVIELTTPEEEHLGRQGESLMEILCDGHLATVDNADGDVVFWRAEELATIISGFLRD